MKIPIIEANYPLPVIEPKDPGRVWRAVGGVAEEAQKIVDTLVEIERGKKKVQDALDLQTGIDDYRTRMADYILNLDKDPNKTNYAERVKSGSMEIQNDILGKMKSPNVQNALKVKFSDLGTDYYVKGKIYENDWFMKTKSGDAEEKLFNIAKRAGQAPSDIERAKIGAEGIRLIDTLTGTVFNPEQAAKRKINLSEEIEKEQLKNTIAKADMEIFQNPHTASEILQKNEYKSIPEDKKVSLLNKGIIEANRIEKKIKDDTESFSEQMYGDLKARIRAGENVIDLIDTYGPAGERMLIQRHFDSLLNDIDAFKKGGGKSDDDILLDVTIRSNASIPRISENEINDLIRSKKLSTDDGAKALDQIRTTNRSLRDETKQKENQTYSDAEKHIREGMGVTGLVLQLQEKIDPTQQGLIARANAELWERSAGRGGKEDAMVVAKEILPKYQRALSGQNLLSIESYKKLIDIAKYPNEEFLHFHFTKGWINENDYLRKAKAFKEMREKEQLNRTLEIIQLQEEFGRKKK